MNILFFLKPKCEVAYIYNHATLRQVLETMEYHQYASIPIINQQGKYIGSITEGDLLWGIKHIGLHTLKEAEDIPITTIPRRLDYKAVAAESDMEDLVGKAMAQNFVPVEDDQGNFIGIITRKDIIGYCYDKLGECDK
ncbi:MAG: CBS domain-containing protein [Lachnospiraceae bacterium]